MRLDGEGIGVADRTGEIDVIAGVRCERRADFHLGEQRVGERHVARTGGVAREGSDPHDVVSGERDKIMEDMRAKADQDSRKIGVQIVDVRIKRVDLPSEVSESVYRRMEAERKRVANELRSQGSAEAEKIRADADKQREVIVAEAYRDAQKVKGDGDAKAAALYAQAFNQNPEFYAFYRSLEAYRSSFRSKNDIMVIEPNSDFFKYLKGQGRSGDKNGK